MKRKLTPERAAELENELRLRTIFSNKRLCRRYGISLSTLKRAQRAALERPLPATGAATDDDDVHVLYFRAPKKETAT